MKYKKKSNNKIRQTTKKNKTEGKNLYQANKIK